MEKMANIKDLKNYKQRKKAKVYAEHLEAILKVVNLSIKGLDHFEAYIPVHRILLTMREQKSVLEDHLKSCNKLMNRKDGNE